MQKVIIINGITGIGKTRLANEIAKMINGEIIVGDSLQLY
jgi:tRNA A37 N6-isopentenylltransferase MiaA